MESRAKEGTQMTATISKRYRYTNIKRVTYKTKEKLLKEEQEAANI